MPPVAFGNDTDPRRWAFPSDSNNVAEVGVGLHWVSPTVSAVGVVEGGPSPNGRSDAYAPSSGGNDIGDSQQRVGLSGFHATASGENPTNRTSPALQGMDHSRIPAVVGGESNGMLLASAGFDGGVPSRQGSPLMHQFDVLPQHVGGVGMVDTPSGVMMPNPHGITGRSIMPSNGMVQGQRGGGPPPFAGGGGATGSSAPRQQQQQQQQRSVFDDPVGMVEHHAGGGPLVPSSMMAMGPEGVGAHDGNMIGNDGVMGGVVHANDGGRNSNMTNMHPHSDAEGRMNHAGGPSLSSHNGQMPTHYHNHHQQIQRQHLRAGGAGGVPPPASGGNPMDLGQGRRPSSAGGGGAPGGPWPSSEDPSMALASVPHSASSLPASAVPTVLERFPGFVRCVMDIAPEVVGWVIGRSGAHIKEMKHRSGCGMWVDQKDLKLYITGADMPRIHAAARLVGDLISKAPVNVNSAGVEDEVTSHMIECPPHLIGLLIGRGGSTIKRIKEESRANVVINQKMMKVIVSGIPQSVRLGVAMIEDVITFGRSAEHAGGIGHHPNFMDFPGSVAFGGLAGIGSFSDYDDIIGDRFQLRSGPPPMSTSGLSGSHHVLSGAPYAAGTSASSYDQANMRSSQQGMPPPPQIGAGAAVAAGGGGGGQPAEMGYHHDPAGAPGGKDMDWSVLGGSSFNMGPGADGGGSSRQQWQQVGMSAPDQVHQHMSSHSQGSSPSQQLQATIGMQRVPQLGHNMSGSSNAGGTIVGGTRSFSNTVDNISAVSILGGGGGSRGGGSRTGSISSGGSPPHGGRTSMAVPSVISGMMGGVGMGSKAVGSPGLTGSLPATVSGAMARLSITSDDSTSAGQSVGQASRQRERTGSPVGNPADLAEFLGNMGLGEYTRILRENEIDLEAVQLMADSDFQDIGIPKGPRVKMLYAVRTNRHPPKSGGINTMKAFLASLGLDRYCKAFEDGEVDMSAVDVMEESDYAQLSVAKGPRLKIMNVLSKSGSGIIVNGNNSVGGGSVSVCSPELRHSPEFTSTAAPFSTLPGTFNTGSLRGAITPPRRPSTSQTSVEDSSEHSSDCSTGVSNSPSGNANSNNTGIIGIDSNVDGADGISGSRAKMSAEIGTLDNEAFSDAGGRGSGLVFGGAMSAPAPAWATGLGEDGQGIGRVGVSGKMALLHSAGGGLEGVTNALGGDGQSSL